MFTLRMILFIYFIISVCWTVIDCQPGEYVIEKTSTDSLPNEQPLVLIGRKRSKLAVPEMMDGIPYVSRQSNEELVLACPEPRPAGESASFSSDNSRLTTSTDDTRGTHSSIRADSLSIWQKTSSAAIDTHSTGTTPTLEESGKDAAVEHIMATKQKGKFSLVKDIKFSWELPYLKCNRPAHAFAKKQNIPCNDGEIYEIGFKVKRHRNFVSTATDTLFKIVKKRKTNDKKYEWYPIITVCYNKFQMRTMYAKHTLYGAAVKAAAKLMLRPNIFDYEEPFQPFDGVDLTPYYEKEIQYQAFVKILGEDIAYTYNDTLSKYLMPVQLVPLADMPFPVWTLATNSYLNTTPVWESVALKNWRKIENAVRKLADEKNLTLDIYTGTAQILLLRTSRGDLKEIYLDYNEKPVRVAGILFKLVYNGASKEAIVFYTVNNPYINEHNDPPCRGICEEAEWMDETWKNLDRGYTSCCHYDEVKKSFSLPDISVGGILTAGVSPNQPNNGPATDESANQMTTLPSNLEGA